MGNWSWLRIGTLAAGVIAAAASFVFPPVAAVTAPVGAGLIGLALKAPGTLNKDHAVAIGCQVADAAVNAAVAGAGAGKSGPVLGQSVAKAAGAALAQALPPKR